MTDGERAASNFDSVASATPVEANSDLGWHWWDTVLWAIIAGAGLYAWITKHGFNGGDFLVVLFAYPVVKMMASSQTASDRSSAQRRRDAAAKAVEDQKQMLRDVLDERATDAVNKQ